MILRESKLQTKTSFPGTLLQPSRFPIKDNNSTGNGEPKVLWLLKQETPEKYYLFAQGGPRSGRGRGVIDLFLTLLTLDALLPFLGLLDEYLYVSDLVKQPEMTRGYFRSLNLPNTPILKVFPV